MRKQKMLGLGLILLLAGAAPGYGQTAAPKPQAPNGPIIQLNIDGIIDPVVARYVDRGLLAAEKQNARLVVIVIDTPGGLDASMRRITKRMLNAKVATAVFVYPEGSRAASAGAFIGMSANILAMAPGTNLGAAHPVDLQGEKASDKITNDAEAYMQSLAQKRGRNVKLAGRMVRDSISQPAEAALASGCAEVMARNVPELLQKISNRVVYLENGPCWLEVAQVQPIERPMRLDEKFLHALTNPNVTYILFLIGIYGLIYELANPGAILPGVAGAICMLLALMGFEGLPIALAGILLLVLGAGLLLLEAFVASHGILAVGGVVALILGTSMAYPSQVPDFKVATGIVWAAGIGTLAYAALFVWIALQLRKKKVISGIESLVGEIGAVKAKTPDGFLIHVRGDDWLALPESGPLRINQKVKILAVQGLRVQVESVEGNEQKD